MPRSAHRGRRPGRSSSASTVFALHPHQARFAIPAGDGRSRCRRTCRPSARCSRPTWRPRSRRLGCGRRAGRPGRGRRRGRRRRAGRDVAPGMPGAEVTLIDVNPARAALAARARVRLCPARRGARGLRRRHPCQRQRRRARHRIAPARGARRRVVEASWYGAARSRCRSARPSTAGACDSSRARSGVCRLRARRAGATAGVSSQGVAVARAIRRWMRSISGETAFRRLARGLWRDTCRPGDAVPSRAL
jgi:hypothetical protein